MENVKLIVAKSINNVIGDKNNLLWHLCGDLKHFKELTFSDYCIMGRETHESILKQLKQPLPNRIHLVLTTNKNYNPLAVLHGIKSNKEIKSYKSSILLFHSDTELIDFILKRRKRTFWVIGGAQIYDLMLPYIDELYITDVLKEFEGDTRINLNEKHLYYKVEESDIKIENNLSYRFTKYKRKLNPNQ